MTRLEILKEQERLLGLSVEHWLRVEAGKEEPEGDRCPLCQSYKYCYGGCPVAENTKEPDCQGTPFRSAWVDWHRVAEASSLLGGEKWEPDERESAAMRAETDYLRSVKRNVQAKIRREEAKRG